MTVSSIKYYVFQLSAQPHAKQIIGALNQADRKILNRVIKGKAISEADLKQLNSRLEHLKSQDPSKLQKKHKPISHAIQNLWKRISSKKLILRASQLQLQIRPDPSPLAKQCTKSSLSSLESTSSINLPDPMHVKKVVMDSRYYPPFIKENAIVAARQELADIEAATTFGYIKTSNEAEKISKQVSGRANIRAR